MSSFLRKLHEATQTAARLNAEARTAPEYFEEALSEGRLSSDLVNGMLQAFKQTRDEFRRVVVQTIQELRRLKGYHNGWSNTTADEIDQIINNLYKRAPGSLGLPGLNTEGDE